MDEHIQRVPDPHDIQNVDLDAANNAFHYALYAVFRLADPLPTDADTRRLLIAESVEHADGTAVTTCGWYDTTGFRADADLVVWQIDDDPRRLQGTYHRLRASALDRCLEPVWMCMGLHTPAEFNRRHVPTRLSGVAPHDWLTVYPFIRFCDWYLLKAEERSCATAEHGRNGFSQYPGVEGSTLATFGLNDYEQILGFEANNLDRLEGVLRAQRYTEACLYVREDTPFFMGRRVSPIAWGECRLRAWGGARDPVHRRSSAARDLRRSVLSVEGISLSAIRRRLRFVTAIEARHGDWGVSSSDT